jgi:hypothetical protein
MLPVGASEGDYWHEDEQPTNPRDELELKFGDDASEEAIEEAIALVTRGGREEWAPGRRRIKPADFDSHVDEDALTLEEQDIEEGLQELEELVAAWREARPPMGHNAPPEGAVENDWPTDAELDEIDQGISAIRQNLRKPARSLWAVKEALGAFSRLTQKLLRLAKGGAVGVVRFGAEAAAAAGVGEAVFHPADFAAKLSSVSGMVEGWLRIIGS